MKILQKVLREHVLYKAHPEISQGTINLTGAAGEGDNIDSCVLISPHAMIDATGSTTLGRWVYIAGGVKIYTHRHDLSGKKPLLLKEMIEPNGFTIAMDKEIHDDVWIFESIILPQCQYIAKGVIVGAGSVVTKNIDEEYSVWAGNPARKIGIR